jgi:hypothetical protein
VALFEWQWPVLPEPTIYDFGCKGTPPGGLRNPASSLTTEVPMTMHDHHHIADAGDAEFDATMKMVGMDIVLVMIAGMVLGYFYL